MFLMIPYTGKLCRLEETGHEGGLTAVFPSKQEPDVIARATNSQKWGQREGPMDKK